jgi:hypothetical protein
VKHSAKASARQASAGQTTGAGETTGWRRLTTQLPYGIVLAGVVAGLATIRSGNEAVRGGTLVIASSLLAGAVARLVLPDTRAGMLKSRRRLMDVAALAALGVGLLVAGLIAKVPGS